MGRQAGHQGEQGDGEVQGGDHRDGGDGQARAVERDAPGQEQAGGRRQFGLHWELQTFVLKVTLCVCVFNLPPLFFHAF